MYNTILLAAALQHWDRYSDHALAARELALFIARHTTQRLHVLSAYEYTYQRASELPPDMAAQLRQQEVERTDAMMQQKLADYCAPLKEAGLEITEILRIGSPREIIVQVAKDIDADLLIMGSHSKRGIIDIALGGTAQSVSRRAPCNVVLVAPKA